MEANINVVGDRGMLVLIGLNERAYSDRVSIGMSRNTLMSVHILLKVNSSQ